MKLTLNIFGGLLVVLGSLWFLQGINVLPGSFMTGQIQWAIYGGVAVFAGISLLLIARQWRNDGLPRPHQRLSSRYKTRRSRPFRTR
jgi:hypothetical protein